MKNININWNIREINFDQFNNIILTTLYEQIPGLDLLNVSNNSRIIEDLGADSVDLISIWSKIEIKLLKFNLILEPFIDDNDIIKVKTVEDLYKYIYFKIKKK